MLDAPLNDAAEALARRLLQDIPPRQPVAREALDGLPTPVARLLHRQLDARADREAASPVTPWIDADHPAIRDARSSWRDAARTAARVPAEVWEDTLAEAARDALAYLVEPAPALAASAFADADEPLPTPLVLDRLRALSPFPYLVEIVERYVEKKGLGHIDRDGLERLLQRIDHRMVAGFSADEWIALLDPLFELLEDAVPAGLLSGAFETRGQHQLVADLAGEAVSQDALRAHLAHALATAPAPEATTKPPAPAPSVEAKPLPPPPPVIGSKFNAPEDTAPDDSDVLGPARPVEIIEPMVPMASLSTSGATITDAVVTVEAAAGEDEPLWKRHVGSETLPADMPSTDTPLWAQFSETRPTGASQTVASAVESSTKPAASPALRADASLDDLELAVFGASDPDRRAWYTEELFSGDAADYRKTLLQLDAARTWTEATDIIARDVFRRHSVNIYSDPALTFTDAVQATMEAQ